MKKKKLSLKYGAGRKIMERFGVHHTTVWKALTNKSDSVQAMEIRQFALDNGYVKGSYPLAQ